MSIALEAPRPNRDVDVYFNLDGNSGGGFGFDPRNELNMSQHRPRKRRPTRTKRSSKPDPAKHDLGIRFIYDMSIYPPAFVVDHVRPNSVAMEVATTSTHSFGLGSRLIGVDNRNILIMPEREAAKFLQDTVARATFSSSTIAMRFDNVDLSHDLSRNSSNLKLWGQISLSQMTQQDNAPAPETSQKRNRKSHKKQEPVWDVMLHGPKPSNRQPRNQTRFGSVPCVGGNFTNSKRFKDLEQVHTGTQANVSSFGKNALSTSRTSPGFSIGLSTREDWKKVGFEGVVKVNGEGSSGQFSCFGSKKISFGVSKRPVPGCFPSDPGYDSPGPAGYPEKYGMGPGSLSVARSATFGVSKRKTVATNFGLDSPGPIYDPKFSDAIGVGGAKASFGVGPAHCPPGLNLSPFKNYDEVKMINGEYSEDEEEAGEVL